jgi:chemotaxis protein methyltransferase CheR
MNDEDCVAFLQWALPSLGMRWAGFRKVRRQVCKRIARRIGDLGLSGFPAYRRHLNAEPDEWRQLDSCCRVTISRFYRDRGVFELIRDRLLPELAATEAVLRCWCAGCASGEEPYTMSILWRMHLRDRFPGVRLSVLATDADETLLERARTARYPRSSLREMAPESAEAAFVSEGGELVLCPSFREGVVLLRQDIRSGMPEGPFHMVLCRNLVFTYFEPGLQGRLLGGILKRLLPGGFLIMGAQEDLPAGYLVAGAHEALPLRGWPLERVRPGMPVFRHL